MPYSYLNINQEELDIGISNVSYLPSNLQELYGQQIQDSEKYFGTSDDDIIEFTLYNSEEEPLSFNRIFPTTTYSVLQGSYQNINYEQTDYVFNKPFTNYAFFNNSVLLNTRDFIKQSGLNNGLYYVLYNFIRNVAGTPDYNLVIKEISPSRTEIRLSFAYDTNSGLELAELNTTKTSTFADKKYLFLQLSDQINNIIDNNPISQNFSSDSQSLENTAALLGFKTLQELSNFIVETYTGFDKIINLSNNDKSIQQISKFIGIDTQIKNFTYTYNDVPFTSDEILLAFKTIVTKVSQDRILQKTSLNQSQLETVMSDFVQIIYTDWIEPEITSLLENYAEKYFGLYKNALNFGNGQLVKILDHTSYLNPIDGLVNVQIKLDEPLPLEYDIRTVCWISNISISPLYFKANLFSEALKRNVELRGTNFDINVESAKTQNEPFSEYNNKTLLKSKSLLKQKVNDLLIDYNNFSNFIIYSSAELRTKIAKNKILDYNKKENQKLLVIDKAGLSNNAISASYSIEVQNIVKEQINLLDSFDEYESYLFFNTSSINDKIEDGIDYDSENIDSLLNQLPEYIREDEESLDYLKFTSMVGHFFDNIMIYIKKFPKTYPLGSSEESDYPKNYLDELLNSFNWKIKDIKVQDSDVTQYFFNQSEFSSSLSSSYFNYGKSILNRFANNLPAIYKTKGTSNSFDLLRSIFGIPSGLINTREYGTADVTTNRPNYYGFDTIVYLTNFKDDRYIKFDYNQPFYKYEKAVTYTETGSIVGTIGKLTSSFSSSLGIIDTFSGFNTIESSFRFKSKNYNFRDKIPIIQKTRNGAVDWNICIEKTQQDESGKLVFNIHPPESGYTSSIVSNEMPFLNGNLYTFMITRDLVDSVTELDVITNIGAESSSYKMISPKERQNFLYTEFTSSAEQKYVPYKYNLSVNQYDGSIRNFFDTKTKIINYGQNSYFSSGSFYVGNYNSEIKFVGNIDKIKVLKETLSQSDFDEHSYNINSISIPTKSEVYKNLLYLWSFDTPIELWPLSASNPASLTSVTIPNQNTYYTSSFTAFNFAGDYVTLPYPECVPAVVSKFPYQFDKVTLKQAISANNYGPNYKNNVKINKINEVATSNLVPYDNSTGTDDVVGADSNTIGFYISPFSYLEDKIEDFIGKEGITDIIGNPEFLTDQNYPELNARRKEFAELGEKYIYPQEFYTTYKLYIDFSIFDYIKQLSPSRSSLKRGLLIEPSVFDRKKFNYKDVTYNVSGLYTSSMVFDNKAELTPTFTTGSNMFVKNDLMVTYKTDRDQYNYSRFEIPSSIDDRDFIYSKYGKYINITDDGFISQSSYLVPGNEYYQMMNNDGNYVTFSSSFNKVTLTNLETSTFKNVYRGYQNSGYSQNHLSKQSLVGSPQSYVAVSGSHYKIVNGVKTFAPGKLQFYTYIKGRNDSSTTINRSGDLNGTNPVITIPGYLSLNISSSNSPQYGTLTGSITSPKSLFVPLPLTASMETSASLEEYIMNL